MVVRALKTLRFPVPNMPEAFEMKSGEVLDLFEMGVEESLINQLHNLNMIEIVE